MNQAEREPLTAVNRRSFLVSLGGLTVGVAMGGAALAQSAASAPAAAPAAPPLDYKPWIVLGADGSTTLYSPASEMGQGTMTALPLCVAEELDCDWSRVKVIQAPVRRPYGNPMFGGLLVTGASRSTRGYFQLLRMAGAQARLVLVQGVAARWGVPATELTTRDGVITHAPSGRKMGYGEASSVIAVPERLPEVTPAMLKAVKDFRHIGKDNVRRVDLADKTTGKAGFGIDVRLEGMVYAALARAPSGKERPLSVDDSKAREVKGYLRTVRLPDAVAVVATNTWAAMQARNALVVSWSAESKASQYDSERTKVAFAAVATALATPGVEVDKRGDARAGIDAASRVLKADFVTGHLAHGTMEPMNATARFSKGKLEVWAPTQGPSGTVMALAAITKMKAEDITVYVTLLGGGFGRRTEVDFAVAPALIAREMEGVPVKVTWSREDDIRYDRPRPVVAQHLEVGLDKAGGIVGWHHRIASETIYGRLLPAAYKAAGGKDAPVHEGSENHYDVQNRFVEFMRQDSGIDVGFWRGVGAGYTKLAVETMIDEIAAVKRVDPLALRLDLLKAQPRAQAVLRAVAKMAQWDRKRPKGRALGVAYAETWETHTAEIIEISLDPKDGHIVVHGVWAAVDAGIAILPGNVARQVEGGIVWGLAAALTQELTYKDGAVEQSNFGDFPIPRMNDLPRIEVQVIQTDNTPGGVGETGVPPVAPAIANAYARLTGRRLRSLPFRTEAVKAA